MSVNQKNIFLAPKTKEQILSEIRMHSSRLKASNTFIAIVEGISDLLFWKKIKSVYAAEIILIQSHSGKAGVYEIIENFSSNKKIFGICDIDYERVKKYSNCFYYDGKCLEIMIMKSKAVQENFYHEYYSGKFNANEFVKEFCQMLLQISLFRKINEEYRFNFNFQCISICDCFNKGNETFDWEDTKHKLELANRELTYKFNIIVNKVEKEAQKCFTEDELGMLTDGHDLVRLMAAASYKNISHSNLEVVLRAMYRKDDYLKTEVYQSITRYLDNGTT